MENTTDLLQIKIEKAKVRLPENTLNAINAVPWQAIILQMRETKGYSFEQLGELETETELLLCGLLNPENYRKELKDRMKLSDVQVNDLINEMNKLVFIKIKEELIRGTGNKKDPADKTKDTQDVLVSTAPSEQEKARDTEILKSAGIEIIPEKLEITGTEKPKPTPPILTQKLSGFVKNSVVETDHSLHNISGENKPSDVPSIKPKIDPYREIPE